MLYGTQLYEGTWDKVLDGIPELNIRPLFTSREKPGVIVFRPSYLRLYH